MIRTANDAEVDLRIADRIRDRTDAEAQIGEPHRQSYHRRLGRPVPHARHDVIFGIRLEQKGRDWVAVAVELNVGIVPRDAETELHQVGLRIDERIWTLKRRLIDRYASMGRATPFAFRQPRAAAQPLQERAEAANRREEQWNCISQRLPDQTKPGHHPSQGGIHGVAF
ncbi:MAG TPA: hypothetical protein VGQ22_24575 [Steroidobacteraceae bacterium]|jgi:hypothetical protein|nr:hypothetical protein [Steroidobacteraceae bacterium]